MELWSLPSWVNLSWFRTLSPEEKLEREILALQTIMAKARQRARTISHRNRSEDGLDSNSRILEQQRVINRAIKRMRRRVGSLQKKIRADGGMQGLPAHLRKPYGELLLFIQKKA